MVQRSIDRASTVSHLFSCFPHRRRSRIYLEFFWKFCPRLDRISPHPRVCPSTTFSSISRILLDSPLSPTLLFLPSKMFSNLSRKICRTFLEISWNFLQCLNRLSSPLGFYPSTAFSNAQFFQEFSHLPQSSVAVPPFFPGGNLKVCTRNDDLEDVISRTPISRREDLVFLQNSVLAPLLEKHGLAKNTQARSLDLGRYSIEIENFSCETFILFFWKLIFASCVCYFLSTPRS